MKISFFRTPSPKTFTYQPRYWDERKEELEKIRTRYANKDKGNQAEKVKERISMRWNRRIDRRTKRKSSALTLLVYLLIIALLVWFIFF